MAWYDLDLPEVMALRAELLGEGGRGQSIACSALDLSWLEQVRDPKGAPCLFLAEGVLPYLEMSDVQRLVLMLRDRYPSSELVFDALSPLMVRLNRLKPGTRDAASLIRWTLSRDRELEQWGEGLRLLESWDYFQQREPRLGLAYLFRFLPPLAHGARVLRYLLGRPG